MVVPDVEGKVMRGLSYRVSVFVKILMEAELLGITPVMA